MKKLITVLGLLLIPLSFTSADWNSISCIEYNSNSTNVVYDNTILTFNNGNFATQRGSENMSNVMWLTRNGFCTSSNCSWLSSSFGYIDGKPYLYAGYAGDNYQGYAQNVCIESLDTFDLTTFGRSMSSCNSQDIDMFLTNKNIVGGGYCYPDSNNTYAYSPFTYCFYDTTNAYCFKLTSYKNSSDLQVLTLNNSIGLSAPLTPTKLLNVERSTSPFTNTPTQQTYNEYACPTIQQLLNTYGEEYNTGLCYGSNIIYTGGTIQTITPKSIFELYPSRIELNQDIQNYNAYCNNATTTQACQTIFEGKTEEYTLIAKIPQNIQAMKLYGYCNLSLNYEPTQTTCTATGITAPGITINDIISEIGEGDYTVITPGKPPQSTGTGNGSGSVYDHLLGDQEDDTERRNVIQNAKNIIKTMKELYAKFTGIFRGREGTQGVIPFYITGLILLIVLFKLFKR